MHDVIIVGAGAAGLMVARELSRAGKKVAVLEVRDRIGGRIMPLNEQDFGYAAEGGAEWVHAAAPITKGLVKEAGLTLIPEGGEIWSARSGELSLHKSFIQGNNLLKEKLEALTEDVSIFDFLEENFKDKKDAPFKNSILKMVAGYDAADPKLMSTFTLRDEWLGNSSLMELAGDHRIKEGYGALLSFLESECIKLDVKFYFNSRVVSIKSESVPLYVQVLGKEDFKTSKVVLTVPLPVLSDIKFGQNLDEKHEAIKSIGFGNAIKVLIKFKTRWWEKVTTNDLTKMAFILSNEKFLTWWTQYPVINNVLTGWMAGIDAANYKKASAKEILEIALISLSNVFKIDKNSLAQEIILYEVLNWPADPFTKGAYSYTTYKTGDAYNKLAEPINNQIFFAGEALYSGEVTATVEGAFGSGLETAQKILDLK